MRELSKYEVSRHVEIEIAEYAARYGKLKRTRDLVEVRGLLEMLGFTIGDSLDPPMPGSVKIPVKDPPSVIRRINRRQKRSRRS